MSRENVELVQRCFDLFGRGEMEAVLQYVDPAMETIEPPEIPGSATYRGHSGLAKAYEHWASQWRERRGAGCLRLHGARRQARPHADLQPKGRGARGRRSAEVGDVRTPPI